MAMSEGLLEIAEPGNRSLQGLPELQTQRPSGPLLQTPLMGRGGADDNDGHRLRRSVDPAALLYGRDGLEDDQPELEENKLEEEERQSHQTDSFDLDDMDEVLRVSAAARRRLEYVEIEKEIKTAREAWMKASAVRKAGVNEWNRAEKFCPSIEELHEAQEAVHAKAAELDEIRKEGDRCRRIAQKINDLGGFATGGSMIAGGIAFGIAGAGIAFLAVGGGAILAARHFSRKAQGMGSESFSQGLRRRNSDELPDGPWKDAFIQHQGLREKLDEINEKFDRVSMIRGAALQMGRQEEQLKREFEELENRREALKTMIEIDSVS
jgi:hypothetical protein